MKFGKWESWHTSLENRNLSAFPCRTKSILFFLMFWTAFLKIYFLPVVNVFCQLFQLFIRVLTVFSSRSSQLLILAQFSPHFKRSNGTWKERCVPSFERGMSLPYLLSGFKAPETQLVSLHIVAFYLTFPPFCLWKSRILHIMCLSFQAVHDVGKSWVLNCTWWRFLFRTALWYLHEESINFYQDIYGLRVKYCYKSLCSTLIHQTLQSVPIIFNLRISDCTCDSRRKRLTKGRLSNILQKWLVNPCLNLGRNAR